MEYEEMEKLSLEESKKQTKERREEGLNMIRPFTFDEKKLLWDGLREKKVTAETTISAMTEKEEYLNAGISKEDAEKTTSQLLMEGFIEEQKQRELEEEND